MVSYGDVRRWKSEPLDSAERQLKRLSDRMLELSDEFDQMGTPGGWTGEAADAAQANRSKITDQMEDIVAGVAAARTVLMQGADAIIGLGRGVREADGLAQAKGFTIGDDGAVTDSSPPEAVAPDRVEEVRAERKRIQAELVDRSEQILRHATDIDHELTAVLDKVTSGEITDKGATTLADAADAGAQQGNFTVVEPPKSGSPSDNASWWASLSDKERQAVLRDHPEWVGNRDGLPAADRSTANRAMLADKRAKLEEAARALQADLDDNWFGGTFTTADDRLAEVKAKIASLDTIEQRLESTKDAPPEKRYYLLELSTNDDGRAILAKGNPDTAANVATFVPGTGTNLGNFDDQVQRGDAMWGQADRLPGKASTSVVTWLGYDAPDGLTDAIYSEPYATDARKPLDNFQDGLRVAHEGERAHNTIIGHSYGSTVAGHTARDEHLDVDDFVAVGSPGVGVDDVSGLHLSPGHVWAIAAENDPVADTQVHGNSPADGDFGANTINSAPGTETPIIGYSTEAHSQYWDPHNPALRGIAQVIQGQPVR